MQRLALALVCLASFVSPAAAQTTWFAQQMRGGVAVAGNTIGLAHQAGVNGPGTSASIGTFTTLHAGADLVPASATPWPDGTTSDWTQNGSAAVLDLPAGAVVLDTFLVWGGSWNYAGEVTAMSTLDTPVTLSFGAETQTITPSSTVSTTIVTTAHTSTTTYGANYYVRGSSVTSFVSAHGAGTYAVSGIPATQAETINSLNAGGWTLFVTYADDSAPWSALRIVAGAAFVDEIHTLDYPVDSLCVPSGDVDASLFVAAMAGDASLSGDALEIAPTTAGPFVALAGPNNPMNDFFASQINGADGRIDVRGTFGGHDSSASAGTIASGARQGWDVTRVALSTAAGTLASAQSSLRVRALTTGDAFIPVGVALAVPMSHTDIAMDASVPAAIAAGVAFPLTMDLTVTGPVSTDLASFILHLDGAFDVVSLTLDGATVPWSRAPDLNVVSSLPTLTVGAHSLVLTLRPGAGAPLATTLGPALSWEFTTCGTTQNDNTSASVSTHGALPDAGAPPDAGRVDDAGRVLDASRVVDAAIAIDASSAADAAMPAASSGSCHASPGQKHGLGPVALFLVLALQAKKRRASRSGVGSRGSSSGCSKRK